jgi:hypothetical protein
VVGSRDTLGTAKARSCGQLALKAGPTVCIAIRIQTGVGAVPKCLSFAGGFSLPFGPAGFMLRVSCEEHGAGGREPDAEGRRAAVAPRGRGSLKHQTPSPKHRSARESPVPDLQGMRDSSTPVGMTDRLLTFSAYLAVAVRLSRIALLLCPQASASIILLRPFDEVLCWFVPEGRPRAAVDTCAWRFARPCRRVGY